MPRPRKEQVNLEATPYYHVIGRCVRRARLCGTDPLTGQDCSHRKAWIQARMALLVECFAMDLGAFTILDNHYHALLHVDAERARTWSEHEVARRWLRLFRGPQPVRRWMDGEALSGTELELVHHQIGVWRERLYDLSWFMKCLNEYIARRANEEDHCKGRFWEERFVSQALLDDPAVLGCMVYIDLNPVRAGITATPEESDYTSVQQRIRDWQGITPGGPQPLRPRLLRLPGDDEPAGVERGPLGFRLRDYLELVDWSGRAVRTEKAGAIPAQLPPILERLRLDDRRWLRQMRGAPGPRPVALGGTVGIRRFTAVTGRRWIKHARLASCFAPC